MRTGFGSKQFRVFALAAGIALAAGAAFPSTIVYSNPYNSVAAGENYSDCLFSSYCDSLLGTTDVVAQSFTIGAGAVITSADFTELDPTELAGPTSAGWAFYTDAGGLPGAPIASGTAAIDGSSNGGIQIVNYPWGGSDPYFIDTYSFDVPSVALAAGTYFFALSTTTDYRNYLVEGLTNSGAAEFLNGGPWTTGYGEGFIGGVAVELDSSAPEPATLGLLGLGLGALGLVSRRKSDRRCGDWRRLTIGAPVNNLVNNLPHGTSWESNP